MAARDLRRVALIPVGDKVALLDIAKIAPGEWAQMLGRIACCAHFSRGRVDSLTRGKSFGKFLPYVQRRWVQKNKTPTFSSTARRPKTETKTTTIQCSLAASLDKNLDKQKRTRLIEALRHSSTYQSQLWVLTLDVHALIVQLLVNPSGDGGPPVPPGDFGSQPYFQRLTRLVCPSGSNRGRPPKIIHNDTLLVEAIQKVKTMLGRPADLPLLHFEKGTGNASQTLSREMATVVSNHVDDRKLFKKLKRYMIGRRLDRARMVDLTRLGKSKKARWCAEAGDAAATLLGWTGRVCPRSMRDFFDEFKTAIGLAATEQNIKRHGLVCRSRILHQVLQYIEERHARHKKKYAKGWKRFKLSPEGDLSRPRFIHYARLPFERLLHSAGLLEADGARTRDAREQLFPFFKKGSDESLLFCERGDYRVQAFSSDGVGISLVMEKQVPVKSEKDASVGLALELEDAPEERWGRSVWLKTRFGDHMPPVIPVDPGKKGGLLTFTRRAGTYDVYTQREWRGRSGANTRRRKRRDLETSDPAFRLLASDLKALPTRKVTTTATFESALKARVLLFDRVFAQTFQAHGNALRRARLKHTIQRRSALTHVARTIMRGRPVAPSRANTNPSDVQRRPRVETRCPPLPKHNRDALRAKKKQRRAERGRPVVAYGSGSGFSSLKGHDPSPTTAIRKHLARHTRRVVVVFEQYTTQACSKCHAPTKPACGLINKHKKIHRLRECETCAASQVGQAIKPGIMHRDKNSCRNIFHLFKCEFRGDPSRPVCLTRQLHDPARVCPCQL